MKMSRPLLLAAVLEISFFGYSARGAAIPAQTPAANDAADRLKRSTEALRDFGRTATGVTRKLFDSARCILIAPRRTPGESSMGASGFVTCRTPSGIGWASPAAVEISDGGVVWSFVGSQMDLMILAQNPEAAAVLQSKEAMFGVGIVIQPGPLTEDQIRPHPAASPLLFSYERSSEGIGGIQLSGATLRQQPDVNAALYGKQLSTSEVFGLKESNGRSGALSPFLAALPTGSREGM